MEKIKVFLADDHTVLRAGLRMLLDAEADIKVVGEAADGEEAVRRIGDSEPDVVLMDITMPGMDGLEATRQIGKKYPDVRVLVLTMHEDLSYLRQFLRAGAKGYVAKKAVDTELTAAIRSVFRGEVYIHPSLAQPLVAELLGEAPSREAVTDGEVHLTERELEVLALIANGYTNQQAAERLFISVKTIESHRAHIMTKLGIRNRAELVRYAIGKGLLQAPEGAPDD